MSTPSSRRSESADTVCAAAGGSDPEGSRLHGRRRGRALRPGRLGLIEELLPRLRVPLTSAASIDPLALFPRPVREVWLEVGFGAGEHLAAQAQAYPDVGLIGCEVFLNGMAALLARVARDRLDNVRVLDDDARRLLPLLPDRSLTRIFVLFPDPWPKMRHHRRRFIQTETLDALARVLADGGEFRFASDSMDYVRWTLMRALAHPAFDWTAGCAADWRERPRGAPATRYETKTRARGARPAFLSFRRRPRPAAPE